MSHRFGFRPQPNIRKRTWVDLDGSRTPGIAIMHAGKVLAHMSREEARAIADQIHDLADQLEHTTENA